MQTLEQGNDWVQWMEQYDPEKTQCSVAFAPTHAQESHGESWEQTDRLFHFRGKPPTAAALECISRVQPKDSHSARTQWLQEHDVHTQFVDAGIGCCWFAQQGDDEPVCGETEDLAVRRLARENGLPWDESFALPGVGRSD